MALYHAMNILSTAAPEDFVHIRFVSGSFIFLSGYAIARFHLNGFQVDWMAHSLTGVKHRILHPRSGPTCEP